MLSQKATNRKAGQCIVRLVCTNQCVQQAHWQERLAPKQNQAQLDYRLDSSISMDVATCSHFASVDIEKGENCCAGTQSHLKLDSHA